MSDAIQPADFVTLYRRAFEEFGAQALWNKRFLEDPQPDDALVIARALRIEGDLTARKLAEEIEAGLPATDVKRRTEEVVAKALLPFGRGSFSHALKRRRVMSRDRKGAVPFR